MKRIAAFLVLAVAAWEASHAVPGSQGSSPEPAAPQASASSPSGESRSIWDGVYSEEQAKRGESLYSGECSSCHGVKLKGNETAPALSGSDFAMDFNGLTLADIFKKIRRTMPQNEPGRLNPQQAADVLTYILSFNKVPSGKTELPPEAEALKLIRFQVPKPEAKEKNN
jgi:mono/diheme cytochrome c family protein